MSVQILVQTVCKGYQYIFHDNSVRRKTSGVISTLKWRHVMLHQRIQERLGAIF